MYVEFVYDDNTSKTTGCPFNRIDIGSYIRIGTNNDLIECDVTTLFANLANPIYHFAVIYNVDHNFLLMASGEYLPKNVLNNIAYYIVIK